jgi:hypothetical protein
MIKENKTTLLLVFGLIVGFNSLTVQADLIAAGVAGVYDSSVNATFTTDANLLGSLESNYGYNNIVNAVIAADPVIHDTANGADNAGSGVYNLSASDFYSGGQVDWFAAVAFVAYLNSIGYGGSSQWSLPTADTTCAINSACSSSQLGDVFYNQLGGITGTNMPVGPFKNVQFSGYWTANEYAATPSGAWDFYTNGGFQSYDSKDIPLNVWAVSSGNVSAVPEPSAIVLFGSVVLSWFGFKRSRQSLAL